MTVLPTVPLDAPLDGATERGLVDPVLRAGDMAARLRGAFDLPAAAPCHVLDAKYEAGSYCTVLYQVGDALLTAVLTLDGSSGPDGGVELGPGLRGFAFPDDPKLPGLAAAMDGATLASALDVGRRTRVDVSLLRYRPGKRATLRLELRGSDTTRVLIGKVYSAERKAAAVFIETRQLAAALAGEPAVSVAPAEAYLDAIPMVVWHAVAGVGMEQRLDASGGADLVHAAAGAVAALHAAPVVSERTRPIAAELARFRRRGQQVARVAPTVGATLLSWAGRLEEAGAEVDRSTTGLVHGDCKPSQFHTTSAGLALLDFDHCGVADPASDVGTFLASLRQRSREALEGAFLHAYAEAVAEADIAERARWYESVALLRKALRAFARSPQSPVPGILAAEGLKCLERGTR